MEPENFTNQDLLHPLMEKIKRGVEGRMKISLLGPESIPPFEQLKAVTQGVFDGLFTVAAYHSGEITIGNGMELIVASSKQRRDAGALKVLDEAYRKIVNVRYLATFPDRLGFQLVLKKKIEKADLTGLKIRATPLYDPMVKGLNGAIVRIADPEIYSAMDKGVIDGFYRPSLGLVESRLYEVAKYLVRPRFGEMAVTLLVNVNSWDRLPKDLQDIINKSILEVEAESPATSFKRYEASQKELLKRGMEILVLPPIEAEKFIDIWYERTWQEVVLSRNPEFGKRLKEISDRMRKKEEEVKRIQ